MYSIANITTEELSKIKVKSQDKIVQFTGEKLDPVKDFEILKKETENFTKETEKGKIADKLFMELLENSGVKIIPINPEKQNGKSKKGGIDELRKLRKAFKSMKQKLDRLEKLKAA